MAIAGALKQLADAYGVATEFNDYKDRHVDVAEDVVIKVLAALGVDASTPESIQQALDDHELRLWRRTLPPVVVMRQGQDSWVNAHVQAGLPTQATLHLEQGGVRHIEQVDNWTADREIDGGWVGEASYRIPGDVPLGYHHLVIDADERLADATVIVTPQFLGFPHQMGEGRVWGYGAQLYSVRSSDSWGIGDLADLTDLSIWSAAEQGANYVLVNPLHASQSRPPMDASPYLPSSRLFFNPMYIRPEMVAEYAHLDEPARRQIAALHDALQEELAGEELIQRDLAWAYKRQALQLIFAARRRPSRQMAFEQFRRRLGRTLRDFATWCVLCEYHGNDWRIWDEELQRPSSPAVGEFHAEHTQEIEFHEWLQWIVQDQLSATQTAAQDAGMSIGVITDLAVGVSGASADNWMMSDTYAKGISVGAPPDGYNQLGQDWGQPPWRPDRLAETAYGPFRAMVQMALSHAGGVRIDHILGMFRLWWIPQGNLAKDGTYVRYDHEALIGIIALEALRSGAIVIGEDLGTVEPWVRDYLSSRGILGTSVLWFETDLAGNPVPPEHWREYCMAAVTTHDLPPTAGYLRKDHVKLRNELGLLTVPVEQEEQAAEQEQAGWMNVLAERDLIKQDTNDHVEDQVLALHRFLVQTNSRVLNVALVDAVGDRRVQNQPGTWKEYPNWQVPLSGTDGRPVFLDEIFAMERPMRLAAVMNGWANVPQPFLAED